MLVMSVGAIHKLRNANKKQMLPSPVFIWTSFACCLLVENHLFVGFHIFSIFSVKKKKNEVKTRKTIVKYTKKGRDKVTTLYLMPFFCNIFSSCYYLHCSTNTLEYPLNAGRTPQETKCPPFCSLFSIFFSFSMEKYENMQTQMVWKLWTSHRSAKHMFISGNMQDFYPQC